MRQYFKRFLALALAVLLTASGCIQPAWAEEIKEYNTETGYPLLEMVRDQLSANEILKMRDESITEGEHFELIDPEWLEFEDDEPVPYEIRVEKIVGPLGNSFSSSKPGTYTVYYVLTPVSGNPAYEISRVITVKAVEIIPVEEVPAADDAPDDEPDWDGAPEYDDEEMIDEPVFEEVPAEEDEETFEEDPDETPEVWDENPENIDEEDPAEDGSEVMDEEIPAEPAADEAVTDEPEADPDDTINSIPEKTPQAPSAQPDDVEYDPAEDDNENASEDDPDDVLEDFFSEDEIVVASIDEADDEASEEGDEDDEDDEDDPDNIVIEGPAKVTRGSKISYPSDLGSYSTFQYYVDGKYSYCLEADTASPKGGSFAQEILDDNPDLIKALYYGYGGPGDITASYFPGYSSGLRTILTHIAASYFYTGSYSRATKGCSSSGLKKYGVEDWINYLSEMPDPPSPRISLSETALGVVSMDGGIQTTGTTKLKADERNSITLALPDNVTYHDKDTGETQTGGAVQIAGGTTFFFSAPVSMNGVWSTGDMSGAINTVWKALIIKTGTKTQNLGSYVSESYGGSVHFSVEWESQATLNVIKADAENADVHLEGAVIGVYSDADCTDQLTTMRTGSDGTASCTLSHATVYVKELTAPVGYRLNSTAYSVDLTKSEAVTMVIKNEKQRAGLKIMKKGEMLTGANVSSTGVEFIYQVRRLVGAAFRVTADSNIYRADGTLIYQKGTVVAGNLVTNADGEAFLDDLPLGQYLVEEIAAPEGYVLSQEKKTVTLEYAGQEASVAFDEVSFLNERQKVDVRVHKTDAETGQPLAKAQIALFTETDIRSVSGKVIVKAGTMIESRSTGKDGNVHFTADLPIGYPYSVHETRYPAGYAANNNDYSFLFSPMEQTVETMNVTSEFTNTSIRAEFHLKKVDKETGRAQGDASLIGAVYGLYAREGIAAPDGTSGLLYERDALIYTLTTDAHGEASVTGLYPGKYYVKEITPPTGYLLDANEYDIDCSVDSIARESVGIERTVTEQVAKQPFQIIKAAKNGKTDADLLEGAGFSAWLISDLSQNADGSYDFSSAAPVVLGANGATEIFTDRTGHAVSLPLPYGTYIVRETTTPANYSPVDDFIVSITENNPSKPQVWRILLDEEFAAKLKITKVDAATGRAIEVSGAEFSIYDLDNGCYVSQKTSYPQPITHNTFKTDESGTLTLPEALRPGHYRVTEITAPNGYLLSGEAVDVTISADSLYRIDSVTGEPVIEVTMRDTAVVGRIAIIKEGEMLTGYENGKFIFSKRRLPGVTFDVFAAEDIYTADHAKDENGNRYLEYAAGTLVTTLVTDANGEACTDALPLGFYSLVEKKTADGFVLDGAAYTVCLTYADEHTPVVSSTVSLENQRQKFSACVEKLNADGTVKLPGAEFALYAGEDIVAGNTLLVSAGACLATATTNETGALVFDIDLPLGKYLIKETKAPAGYVLSDEVQQIEAVYHGQETPCFEMKVSFRDEPVKVAISKADATTGVELDGASLTLMDESGKVIDSWTSVAGNPHMIEGLMIGATYTLREDIAPYGYLLSNAVKFVVGDTGAVQKVIMKDEAPTGTIIITKTGEFLSDVSVLDSSAGWISNAFDYITGNLRGVTFGVYAYEDIPHADGVTGNHYSAGELVRTITTDNVGIARLEGLPLGRYYVKELNTQNGYVLDDQPRMIDLTYRDSKTKVVTFSEAWQNERRKASVQIIKQDKDTGASLEGAVFGLFAGEQIMSGKTVVMKKDALIEQRATDAKGMLTFKADLPVGFSYYVAEITPPDGYAYAPEDARAFSFSGAEASADFSFQFTDERTRFDFTKSSLTTGEEIEGARLQITDDAGNIIAEWVSEKEPHRITGLTIGKTYTLTETLPADGYVTAESISFTVENTGEVQKVEMKDDVTKVQISKTDLGGKELKGAKLTIFDASGKVVESWVSDDEPHYIEMLPIGKYTLREEVAPSGYTIAEDAPFEVKDTGEIQKVIMKDAPIKSTDTPKTGDERNPLVYAVIGIVGLGGLFCALMIPRKRRH